jgi:Ser/Thr protein kinase RdoA (MazF antagonist)
VAHVQESTFGLTLAVTTSATTLYVKLFKKREDCLRTIELHRGLFKVGITCLPDVICDLGEIDDAWGLAMTSIGDVSFRQVLALTGPEVKPICVQIGYALAKLHSSAVTLRYTPHLAISEELRLAEQDIADGGWTILREDVFTDLGVNLNGSLEVIRDCSRRLGDQCRNWETAGSPALLHGDLWASNIMLKNLSHTVVFSGFIDFDYACIGRPSFDLVRFFIRGLHAAVYESFGDILPRHDLWRSFASGYSTVCALPLIGESEWFITAWYQFLRTAIYYRDKLRATDEGLDQWRLAKLLTCLRQSAEEPEYLLALRRYETGSSA